MREGDRLRRLHMGEARHDRINMRLGLLEQAALEFDDQFLRAAAGLAHPQPEIRRHLVVARARGVQAARGLARDLLSRASMLRWMSSSSRLKTNLPCKISGLDRIQAGQDRGAVGLAHDAPGCQMRAWAREPARSCAASRLSKSMEGVMSSMTEAGPLLEPAAPHLVGAHRMPMTQARSFLIAAAALAAIAVVAVLYWKSSPPVHASLVPPASLARLVARQAAHAGRVRVLRRSGRRPPFARRIQGTLRAAQSLGGVVCALREGAGRRWPGSRQHFPREAWRSCRSTSRAARRPTAAAFLKAHGAARLPAFIDGDLAMMRVFGAYGLPLTVLIDDKAARSPAPSAPPTGTRRTRSTTSRR